MTHVLDLQTLEAPTDESAALVSTESYALCWGDPSAASLLLCQH